MNIRFLRHEFLQLAEVQTGCVTPDNGWAPRHLTISGGGKLRAAMPLYEKSHSWGEFVFDWAWANAYEQAGLELLPETRLRCTVYASTKYPAAATRDR